MQLPASPSRFRLKVGVPIPQSAPVAGGAYEFEHTVFNEISSRYHRNNNTYIHFVPIAQNELHALSWSFDPAHCVLLDRVHQGKASSRSLQINRKLARYLQRLLPRRFRIESNTTNKRLPLDKLNVIWSTNPSTFSQDLPFIVTIWDLQHRLQPFFPEVSDAGNWPWSARQHHYSNVATKAFCCVVGTERGRDELLHFFGVDRERILVNPFPCPVPLPDDPVHDLSVLSQFHLKRCKYLLYPAQFWSHKNHLCALYAFESLLKKYPDLKLVLPGSDKGTFSAIKSVSNQICGIDTVVMPGFLDRKILASLYRNCLALVYPSFFGPDNIPPLEAMSYAVPSIVASVPGASEQFGDSVLYFDPRNPGDLARQVSLIVENNCLRQELVARGQKLVKSLTAAAYVNRLEAFLLQNWLPIISANVVCATDYLSGSMNGKIHVKEADFSNL